MVKRIFLLGTPVMALSFALVLAGCSRGVQEVKIVYDDAAAPGVELTL